MGDPVGWWGGGDPTAAASDPVGRWRPNSPSSKKNDTKTPCYDGHRQVPRRVAHRGEQGGDAGWSSLRAVHGAAWPQYAVRRDPPEWNVESSVKFDQILRGQWISEEGVLTVLEEGDRIGILLDFDQGITDFYKNDEWVHRKASGLIGEYCWAVSTYGLGTSARIDAVEVPVPPTKRVKVRPSLSDLYDTHLYMCLLPAYTSARLVVAESLSKSTAAVL